MKATSVITRWFLLTTVLTASNAFANDQTAAIERLTQRVSLLESAFSPSTPQALVTTFAKAVQNRNGAVQYMLFCPSLQKQYLAQYEELNWISGTSSPSLTSYQLHQTSANQFTIRFILRLQGKPVGTVLDQLNIILAETNLSKPQHYCIAAYKRVTHYKSN